jgi:hypothetical protein
VAVCVALIIGAFAFTVIVGDLKPVQWRSNVNSTS